MTKLNRQLTPLLTVVGLNKTVKTPAGPINILKDINMSIPEGSLTIIYGASGSGKTTLLNAMIGLDEPTAGTVTYEGRNLYRMGKNERAMFRADTIGFVQQTNYWIKSLSVLENVALPLYFLGRPREAALETASESLKRSNIQHLGTRHAGYLSGGEQQRVAMARALVNNPSLIVADEPTGNLDSQHGDDLIKILHYLKTEFGRTVVLVTHNLEYLSLADQIFIMEDGSLTKMKYEDSKQITDRLLNDIRKRLDEWRKKA